MNNDWHLLSGVVVNGIPNSLVYPESGYISNSLLNVNGFIYKPDSYIDAASGAHNITNKSKGFSIDYSYAPDAVRIKWNYISDQGGFWLHDGDDISYSFYTE